MLMDPPFGSPEYERGFADGQQALKDLLGSANLNGLLAGTHVVVPVAASRRMIEAAQCAEIYANRVSAGLSDREVGMIWEAMLHWGTER